MSRISHDAMVRAITQVEAMDSHHKEELADEIFRIQPHLFGSFLVQSRLGVSLEKMEFLLNILCISFQAMKVSGLAWPLITEDDLDRQSQRFVAIVKFGYDLSESLRHQSMQHYVADHPEKDLLPSFRRIEQISGVHHTLYHDYEFSLVTACLYVTTRTSFDTITGMAKRHTVRDQR